MNLFNKAISIFLVALLLPATSFANRLQILESVDDIQIRENQNITKIDLFKILLEKDGFTDNIDIPEDKIFDDVDVLDRGYVEKMRQLGVVHYNTCLLYTSDAADE